VKKLAFVLASALALVVVLGASADNGNGNGAQRDNGRGHWFKHACDKPGGHDATCNVVVVTDSGAAPLVSASPPPGALTPALLRSAYALQSGDGSGQTIGIVDAFDDPTAESDLATFSTAMGLPACSTGNGCFKKVNQIGGTSYPSPSSGWSLEVALDVETAHGICPNCKILLVEASSNSFNDLDAAENEAVALGATVVSNSWGGSENSGETSLDTYYNHPGVVITASTGDSGYGVEYPAASRYVTAVGGTSLHVNSDGSWASETAWSGAGSGCSAFESKPAWQTDSGCTHRSLADVSADADPNTGEAIYVSSYSTPGWYQVGGTSLAAPLIASIYALTGTASSANYAATPYGARGSLHDITSGSNGSCNSTYYLCNAVVGYDGPTGLGTPNGLTAFTASDGGSGPPPPPPPADFSLGASPSAASVTAGGSTTGYTVTVAPINTFTASVGLSVSGQPAGVTAGFAPASVTGGSGASTMTVQASASTQPGTYTLTISGTSGTLTHTASVSLTVQPAGGGGGGGGDFTISVSPSSAQISRSGSSNYTVTITRNGGFSSAVSLSATGFASRIRGSFSPSSLDTLTSTSTLTVTGSILPRHTTWMITITGTGGGKTHSTTLTLSTG
jgi:subtilase family serine protease